MKRIKEFLSTLIIFIILVGIIGGLVLLCIKGIQREDNASIIYNNGIHENCGEWRFISAAGNGPYSYYYECTGCHKVLKSTELYNQIGIEESE